MIAVLGGGFGGLAAAIALAAAGQPVVLLEQRATLGGKAGEWRAGGFRFDTGPSVFTLPAVLGELFAQAGRPLPLTLTPLSVLCDYHFASGRRWRVYRDPLATTAQLTSSEATSYRALLELARRLYEAAAPTFVYGDPPTPLELVRYGLRHGLAAHPLKTLPQLLSRYGATGELAQFFLRFATYFGANPYRAPAVLHNIAWVELGLGVSYPEGGIYGVVRALEQLARELGVEIRTGVQVTGLALSGRRVRQVVTDGGALAVEGVISNLDIVRTQMLLGRRPPQARRPPSLSGLVLLLGVEGESSLRHHTISFTGDYPAEFAAIERGRLAEDPTLYLNISCKSDPADAPAGCENWFVMANAPALPLSGSPPDEAAYAAHLIDILARRKLLSPKQIRLQRVLGPSYLAALGYRGSIYGTAPHTLLATLRPRQTLAGIDNLALAGGTVYPGGGIPLCLLSGQAAARQLLARL